MIRVHRCLSSVIVLVLCLLAACSANPPRALSEQDEAILYGKVLRAVRTSFDLPSEVPVHPYLAVPADSGGVPTLETHTFEYEPSGVLKLLQLSEPTLDFCSYGTYGICSGSHLILSQIIPVAERDAAILVTVNGVDGRWRRGIVKLRHLRSGWYVARVDVEQ